MLQYLCNVFVRSPAASAWRCWIRTFLLTACVAAGLLSPPVARAQDPATPPAAPPAQKTEQEQKKEDDPASRMPGGGGRPMMGGGRPMMGGARPMTGGRPMMNRPMATRPQMNRRPMQRREMARPGRPGAMSERRGKPRATKPSTVERAGKKTTKQGSTPQPKRPTDQV